MIAIVGDAMIDVDIQVERVKTMDGVEVYRENRQSRRPGGAANVCAMCKSLCRDAVLFSRGTSMKTRYFSGPVYLHRIDNDSFVQANQIDADRWMHKIAEIRPSIIVVCDHAKGTITKPVMDMLKYTGIPIYVDPCMKSDWSLFDGVQCISANREEWWASPKGVDLSSSLHIRRASGNGVFWDDKHLESICEYPVDTVGAGDQFIAVLACMRESVYPWDDAIKMANIAAGLQCERQGIVPVSWNEMYDRIGLRNLVPAGL